MDNLTNVTVYSDPTKNGDYIFQTIQTKDTPYCIFRCEYDGRDASICFTEDTPNSILTYEHGERDSLICFDDSSLTIYQKLQIISGLFHDDSNFKERLFYCYSYLPVNKKLKCIFFEVPNFKIISVNKTSKIEDIMHDYYKELGLVVLENDSEADIIERHKKKLELRREREEKESKLRHFIYNRFLEEVDFSDILFKRNRVIFFDLKEKYEYALKEEEILYKRFKKYLLEFELDPESSKESHEILSYLKSKTSI